MFFTLIEENGVFLSYFSIIKKNLLPLKFLLLKLHLLDYNEVNWKNLTNNGKNGGNYYGKP